MSGQDCVEVRGLLFLIYRKEATIHFFKLIYSTTARYSKVNFCQNTIAPPRCHSDSKVARKMTSLGWPLKPTCHGGAAQSQNLSTNLNVEPYPSKKYF
jgi:hypothetical protein